MKIQVVTLMVYLVNMICDFIMSGIFFSIFGFSDIAGILISLFVIDSGIKMEILMYILASVGSLGVVLFIFLPNPDDSLLDVKQENKIGIEKDSTIVVIELCTISNSIEKKVANDPITTNVVESGSETSVFAKQISNIWEIMKLDFMIYYSVSKLYSIRRVILDLWCLFWIRYML